jgi:hypothetical protein
VRNAARWPGALAAGVLLLFPAPLFAWGANGHRLITNKAVDTLPPEIRGFFEANRSFLVQKCTAPAESLSRNPKEKPNHFIYIDRYGRFPFDVLPRDYNAAVRKHGRRLIEANGKLPWQIGYYSLKLREALEARNWEEARVMAATLAYYVAAAHDPFNTTENYDGQLSGLPGVGQRFSTSLVDRYSAFFFISPNAATEVRDPTDRAFEITLSAHSWLENIMLADRRARRGLNDYTDEYYDRFYNQAGAILLRQLSDASTEVGSYWLSAWIHAGRPPLPAR